MTLVIAGIDEAGYGPLLGPLCVAMAAFRLAEWSPDEGAPDLWRRLRSGVCRKAADKRRRVAVDDSKRLKLPNDGGERGRHPLTHLERGVLSFLAASGVTPPDDAALLKALAAGPPPGAWYSGESLPLPCAHTAAEIRIAANLLTAAMVREGVDLAAVRCEVMGEAAFNEVVRAEGTKGATTGVALTRHLNWAWDHLAPASSVPGGARIVCDRHGGRTQYGELVASSAPGAVVEVLEESGRASRYLVRESGGDAGVGGAPLDRHRWEATPPGGGREMTVLFMPEADGAHLPVALASMTAKLCRELCMTRFNRYWSARLPELKPTAGYYSDARRWLDDAAPVLTPQERAALVRLA